MAETLLKNKADVNLAFKNGNTPLHFAVASGNLKIVKLLVEKGANKNAKNNKGQTPFDIAIDNDIKKYLKKSQ
jgi:ankyrin repeat protein